MARIVRRLAPAFALYFLAPFIAEFLLGDFPLTYLPVILALAPLYGGGALLIRETARHTGRGWPTMVLLALAFGVFEEGILTQSLFNPDYVGANLLDDGFVKSLGIAVPWTIFVLTLHTVWSISTPIALIEESASGRRTRPWCKPLGMVVTIALFMVGAVITFVSTYGDKDNHHYMASPAKVTVVAIVVVALVTAAFLAPKPGQRHLMRQGAAPRPWIAFALVLIEGGVFETAEYVPTALRVVMMLAGIAGALVMITLWSRRAGWGRWHRFAVASGAVITYAWHSFASSPIGDTGAVNKAISHVVFALVALAILWQAARKVRRQVEVGAAEQPAVEMANA
jgi:hypothetical protein